MNERLKPPSVPEGSPQKQLRDRYTALARQVTGDQTLTYDHLYQRANQERMAQRLDLAVVAAALKQGETDGAYLLAQSPYVQYQKHREGMRQSALNAYSQATVQQALSAVKRQSQQQQP
ncbi:MAG: hypothetical protein GVY17_10080 [Cyanobacteria bacterium]|jgi:hypothetical protein|nr:hypothetical protein [Cyanobacteria bacterium GSL.Bin21]